MRPLSDPVRCIRRIPRAWAWHLCLLLFVWPASLVTPVAANIPYASLSTQKAVYDSLSTHGGSADGFVFPRDGITAQPAIETRKKNLKLPIHFGGGDAAISAADVPATHAIYSHAIARRINALRLPAPRPWQSRAPPGVS